MLACNVTFHPKWWNKHASVRFDEEFFDNPDVRLAADMKMRRVLYEKFGEFHLGEAAPEPRPLLGSDLIAAGYLHSMVLGCDVRFHEDHPPDVICANLSVEESSRLHLPNLNDSPVWRGIQSQIDYLSRRYGRVENCINLMGIQNIALDLRGQALFIDYFENPELAHHVLDVCSDVCIEIGRRLRSASSVVSPGVSAIVRQVMPCVYLTSNCSVELVSLDIYNRFLREPDERLSAIFQPFGIHHCGQTLQHVVEGYRKISRLGFLEAGACSDLRQVRARMPDIHINARYSPVALGNASSEQLEDDILQILADGAPLESLSISCVGIDDSVPDEKVREFLDLCRRHGQQGRHARRSFHEKNGSDSHRWREPDLDAKPDDGHLSDRRVHPG
jgi:hypothetical protein